MSRILLGIWFFVPWLIPAEEPVSVENAVGETRREIMESTRELNQLRDRIQNERLPMAKKLEALRIEAAALRKDVKDIRNTRNLRQEERSRLSAELAQLEAEKDFVQTVFAEYRRSVETRMQSAETQYTRNTFPAEDEALWPAAADWFDLRRGGYRFPGQALDKDGREISGDFLVLGPLGYFVGGESAGLLVTRPGSPLPGIYPVENPAVREGLQALIAGESAELPVDVSGGDAMKVLQARPDLIEHLRQGGVVVIPLLLLGGLALILSLKKMLDLRGMNVSLREADAEKLTNLQDGDVEAGLAVFADTAQPLGSLLVAAVQHRHASRENLEEILHEHVLAAVPRLERSLGALAVLGGVAPLLGLLGTVTGMIHTFQLVTLFGSGNSKTLSGGISEALVTTELGLLIAIPILLIHASLARKSKILLGELEQSGLSMVNLLKSDTVPGHEKS